MTALISHGSNYRPFIHNSVMLPICIHLLDSVKMGSLIRNLYFQSYTTLKPSWATRQQRQFSFHLLYFMPTPSLIIYCIQKRKLCKLLFLFILTWKWKHLYLRGKRYAKIRSDFYISLSLKDLSLPHQFHFSFRITFYGEEFLRVEAAVSYYGAGDCWIVATFLSDSSAHDYDILASFLQEVFGMLFLGPREDFSIMPHTTYIV